MYLFIHNKKIDLNVVPRGTRITMVLLFCFHLLHTIALNYISTS